MGAGLGQFRENWTYWGASSCADWMGGGNRQDAKSAKVCGELPRPLAESGRKARKGERVLGC